MKASGYFAATGLVWVVACGSSVRDAPDDVGQPLDAFCELYRSVCERQVECGAVLINQGTTVEECLAREDCRSHIEPLTDAGAVIDQGALETCHQLTLGASCETLAQAGWLATAPACGALLVGSAAEGESCTGGPTGGCEPGLTCEVADTCPGTCVAQPAGGGPECLGLDCPEGEFCQFGKCLVRAGAGESCEWGNLDEPWDRSCIDDYACSSDIEDPRCVPALEPGAECNSGNVDACKNGNVCVAGTCQAPRSLGEACDSYSECAPGLACDFDLHACRAPKAEGETCSDAVFDCGPGLTCADQACVRREDVPAAPPEYGPRLNAGDDCEGGGVCPLGTSCLCDRDDCERVSCRPGPEVGESCKARGRTTEVFNGDGTSAGSITAIVEDVLDVYRCRNGYCDIFGAERCVIPAEPGETCSFDELRLTFECKSLVCEQRRCLGYEALSCTPN